MTDDELKAIEERANAATPAPWTTFAWSKWAPDEVSVSGPRLTGYEGEVVPADAEFIAHARTDVPTLLAEVRRLREERRSVLGALRAVGGVDVDLVVEVRALRALADCSHDQDKEIARLRGILEHSQGEVFHLARGLEAAGREATRLREMLLSEVARSHRETITEHEAELIGAPYGFTGAEIVAERLRLGLPMTKPKT